MEKVANLDNYLILQQFEEIEKKVESLMTAYRALETTNAELKEKIKQYEQDLNSKSEAQQRLLDEREIVRSKIDGLLARLQDTEEQ